MLCLVLGMAVELARAGAGELGPSLFVGPPADAGRAGGIGAYVGATAWVLAIGLAVAVPVGLLAAIGLAEVRGGRPERVVRASLDVLSAVPSVVFGLFGLALFCEALGLGWSVAAGGLTMACMILPLFVRVAEAGLRSVPDDLRVAGAALGLPRWAVIGWLVLPKAAPALGAGLLLATGRILAESAALMFTAGSAVRSPSSPLDPGRVLAYHVYQMAVEVPGGLPRAAATGLVLLAIASAAGTAARFAPRLVWAGPR